MKSRLLEIGALFLKLGTFGFGGPAVHISLMEQEVVERRQWMDRQSFLDLIGATNLIPGPNSTEMAIHVGYVRGGLRGLIVAGVGFLFPSVLITTTFAALYTDFGQNAAARHILSTIQPAVLAIILTAGWRLAKKSISSWATLATAILAAVGSLSAIGQLTTLFVCGAVGTLLVMISRRMGPSPSQPLCLLFTGLHAPLASGLGNTLANAEASGVSLAKLGWFFLKVGAVLYGSGYVLIAYLEGELVGVHGWLTEEELINAIAVGQLTPGPILSTATFIGYVVMQKTGGAGMGVLGALVATLGIFTPSFVFVLLTHRFIERWRQNAWASVFLDAINAASMGLMAAVSLKLAVHLFVENEATWNLNWFHIAVAVAGIIAVLRWNLSPVWLVFGGATIGALSLLL